MTKVFAEISMSLDGYVAGPNDGPEFPLGEGGESLHEWVVGLASWRERHGMEGGRTGTDSDLLDESIKRSGAYVMGRRMFDLGEEPWGDTPPYHTPVFIVTHRAHETVEKDGGTSFIFVTDGPESALEQAKAAAGDRDVAIIGGGDIIQQYINAGLVDELQIHLVPILLGGGRRLFGRPGTGLIELETVQVIDSPGVTHLKFRPTR